MIVAVVFAVMWYRSEQKQDAEKDREKRERHEDRRKLDDLWTAQFASGIAETATTVATHLAGGVISSVSTVRGNLTTGEGDKE